MLTSIYVVTFLKQTTSRQLTLHAHPLPLILHSSTYHTPHYPHSMGPQWGPHPHYPYIPTYPLYLHPPLPQVYAIEASGVSRLCHDIVKANDLSTPTPPHTSNHHSSHTSYLHYPLLPPPPPLPQVYAIEASGVSRLCHDIVKANDFSHVISVVHAKVEDIEFLPSEDGVGW